MTKLYDVGEVAMALDTEANEVCDWLGLQKDCDALRDIHDWKLVADEAGESATLEA